MIIRVHPFGSTMRVIPDELLRLVELFCLGELFLGWECLEGEEGLQVVACHCGLVWGIAV